MKTIFATIALSVSVAGAAQAQGIQSATVSTSNAYPQEAPAPTIVPILRGCTQLEVNAAMDTSECGRLPLSAVAAAYFEQADRHNDE